VRQKPSLTALVGYFLRLGTFGFGGPVALVAAMHRDLVEARAWVSAEEYREGIALAQLAPGPLAAQLAIYLGWVRHGVLGATLVAVAFVVPSFVMVLVLAALYVRAGGLLWMQAAFYGIGAAVIALISRSAAKLVRSTAGRDRLLWAVVLCNATITAITARELLSVVAASGLLVILVRWWQSRRAVLGPGTTMLPALVPLVPSLWMNALAGLNGLGEPTEHLRLFVFFVKAALVVFGSGLAIIPFLHGGVVEEYGWLTERQFLDAVAVAMITPGPVVITVGFIGYLVAGLPGAILAALGMFLPTYGVVVLMAPWFRRVASNRMLKALVDGVTAAAVGALVGAVIVLGRGALVDLTTIVIALGVFGVLWRGWKVPEPLLILGAGVLGLLLVGTQG
jgi:chromate transporter